MKRKKGKMNSLLAKAQKLQHDLMLTQDSLQLIEVEGAAAGGMVKVILNCKNELKKIVLNPDIVDPDDVELLEDSIVAAFQDAHKKVVETTEEKMSGLTGGLKIPGLF